MAYGERIQLCERAKGPCGLRSPQATAGPPTSSFLETNQAMKGLGIERNAGGRHKDGVRSQTPGTCSFSHCLLSTYYMPGGVQHVYFVLAKEPAHSVYPTLIEFIVFGDTDMNQIIPLDGIKWQLSFVVGQEGHGRLPGRGKVWGES